MSLRRWMNVLLILAVIGALFLRVDAATIASANSEEKIDADLLTEFSLQGQADFIIVFHSQADLSAAYKMGWQERGKFVVSTLQETASESQAQAKGILDAAGLKYQTFIAGNELYVWQGNVALASDLAELPEIKSIRQTHTYWIDPIVESSGMSTRAHWAGELLASNRLFSVGDSPTAIAWGINYTKANLFWTEFGKQGDGIIVANIDTGVQWNHPALDQSFRCGNNPSDPKCWADPANICGGSACDNNGHGTHTMGTMVADDDLSLTYQAGMAPNATWIACKGCENNSCSDYALTACADWILAPGGNSLNRPHVVNNSWGGDGGDTWFQAKVEAWRAAGIFPAFSAGNNGSACNTLGSPGDYQVSFSTAANDSMGNVANFSSRGPSAFGHDPYTKPNITAPGVGICSSIPENSWSCGYNGTSMASPHSAGAVALLWSCNPALIGQIDTTFQALQSTADTPPAGSCGAPPDGQGNYTYGYGYLNILAAGTVYCSNVDKGHLEGYVTDLDTGDPIEGASLSANTGLITNQEINTITDPTGYYSMTLPVGTYNVTASKQGYSSNTINVNIIKNTVKQQDFELQWIGSWMAGPSDPTDFTRYDCTWFDDGSGASSYNQKVYCMGGRISSDSESGEIWRFDPITEGFVTTGNELYESVSNYTANVLKDAQGWAIYVIGGFDVDNLGGVVDYVQRYNPANGIVTLIDTDPMPIKISGVLAAPGACASVQNKVYCFGGWESSAGPYFSSETWEFDPNRPAGSRWDRIQTADLSVGRGYIQTAVQNNIIYAMGGIAGYSGGDLVPSDVVEALDLNNLNAGWTTLATLPVPTGEGRGFGFGADTLTGDLQVGEGKLYVVGGGDWPSESAEVLEYDIISGAWSQDFPELLSARRDHAGVYIPLCTEDSQDGMPGMWVFGGRQGSDTPPYLDPEYFPMPCSEPAKRIELIKTVGTDPLVCADTDHLVLDNPGEVTYCFTMKNTSEVTLTLNDLEDSHLGILLDGYSRVLAPGESFFITQTVTVSTTTINLASWTGYVEEFNSYTAIDYAVVALPGSYFVAILPTIYK